MQQNMQSKGKPLFLLIVVVAAGLIAAAMFHEPALVQAPAEQALDAARLGQ